MPAHALAAPTHGHLILIRMFAIMNGEDDNDVEHRRRQALVQTPRERQLGKFRPSPARCNRGM